MDLEILKIASNTDNHKVLKKCTHNSKLKNSICGDEMEISLNVVKDNIVDFGYQCKSCVYCQASVSLLSKNTLNKKLFNVKNLLKIAETFFEKENAKFPKEWSIFNKIFKTSNYNNKSK